MPTLEPKFINLKNQLENQGFQIIIELPGVSTQVHGQSTSGPEAWQSVYNEAAAGATTIVTVPLLNSFSSSTLQVVFKLTGYWGD